MLSFFKLLQNVYKINKNVGFGIWHQLWRHLTPQWKAEIWVHTAQLLSRKCSSVSNVIWENLLLLRLYELWQLLSVPCGKKLYMCASMFPALNCCGGIFSNLSAIYRKQGAQTVLPIFWTFRNFWPQFRNNCGVI